MHYTVVSIFQEYSFLVKEVVLIINIARNLRESLWLFLVLFY